MRIWESRYKCLLSATVLLATSGCALPLTGREGTRHYIVIGAGIVSIPDPNTSPQVMAAKFQALGLAAEMAPNARLAVGYINSHHVTVDPNIDATVQVSDVVGGPLKVSISTPDSQEQNP